ncbi:hypothetical protein EIP91_004240 [Steccherinum ochraceum]|uniref:Uncharacterized protein n=1 Tax=Steccherinum ochraceum TaxID=92696 RepID=A0A4R0R956_9APHY|nr:hypothetical protein EIP91_004240 [Steccherinum ochraceum]
MTILSGLVNVKSWEGHTRRLEMTKQLYQDFVALVESAQESYSSDLKSMHNGPVNAYLKVLASTGQYDQMHTVFNTLPSTGPLAANEHTYTTVFQILSENAAKRGDFADVRFLWRRLTSSKTVSVDSHVLRAAISALSRGRREDHELALEIVRTHTGLDSSAKSRNGSIPITAQLLQTILELCNRTQNYKDCVKWLQVVMDKRIAVEEEAHVPDRANISQGLLAYVFLAYQSYWKARVPGSEPPQALSLVSYMIEKAEADQITGKAMEPTQQHFELLMAVCTHGYDWATLEMAFSLCTGWDLTAFRGLQQPSSPALKKREFKINTPVLSFVARAAIRTKDPEIAAQAVRILAFFLRSNPYDRFEPLYDYLKSHRYYKNEMASAVLMLDKMVKDRKRVFRDEEEERRWQVYVTSALSARKEAVEAEEGEIPVPFVEKRITELWNNRAGPRKQRPPPKQHAAKTKQ